MLQALEKTIGIVTRAAEMVGINRATHYKWMNEDEEYKEAVDSIGDAALDFVEGKLFELIDGAHQEIMTEAGPQRVQNAPSAPATIFYLKTKGKKRGYIERTEMTGADGKDLVQIIIPKDM